MLLLLLILFGLPAHAHMMSLSSGEAVLEGTRLSYTLTVPLFEIAHTAHPEQSLLAHITFGKARLITQECHPDPGHESYVCHATYEFSSAPSQLEVRCTLAEATVPNHVHLLRATYGLKHDRAVFDAAFTTATLRFRPPTTAEIAAEQIVRSMGRVATGLLPLLFILALATAAVTWPDLSVMAALFLVGQLAGIRIPWQPSPKFLEAMAAVSVAYLAYDVMFLPHSKLRWIIAAGLGAVQGLVLADFIRLSESSLPYAYAGTALADVAILIATAALLFRFPRIRRIPAALTLAASLGWFFLVISR